MYLGTWELIWAWDECISTCRSDMGTSATNSQLFCTLVVYWKNVAGGRQGSHHRFDDFFRGLKIIICAIRVLLQIDRLYSGTNPVLFQQRNNSSQELVYFHHSQQLFRERILTRKRTLGEQCDGDTNIVFVKAKKAKSVPEITKIEIDRMD